MQNLPTLPQEIQENILLRPSHGLAGRFFKAVVLMALVPEAQAASSFLKGWAEGNSFGRKTCGSSPAASARPAQAVLPSPGL